jgi:hypothetical protein
MIKVDIKNQSQQTFRDEWGVKKRTATVSVLPYQLKIAQDYSRKNIAHD